MMLFTVNSHTGNAMINLEDIHSLTDFARNTRVFAKRLKKTGNPTVLTVNGRAEFVVQEASSYQRLLDMASRGEELLKLDHALNDINEGRVHDFEGAVTKLKAKHFRKS